MKKVSFLALTVLLALSIFASDWMLNQTTGGIMPTNSSYKYGGTVVVVNSGLQTPFSINPLSPQAQLPIVPEIYESLFYVNAISGEITPLLGVNYKWEDSNLKLIVKVRNGVKWSDGTPFTANDVAFTFNLIKKYPSFDVSGLWKNSGLKSVEASADTVIFDFSKQNTPLFVNIAGQYIVPEHIWSNIKDPTTFTNTDPVGTGPFLFKSYSPDNQTTIIVKNPNYWMSGRPYVDQVEIQNVNSNNTTLLMMLKHEADWGSSYFPDIMNIWVNKDPQTNKIYWPVNNFNALYLNTQKSPFDNPTFRRAISIAIDKNDLEQKAYFGIGGVANPTGIVPAQIGEWLDPTLTPLASELNTYNPQKAQELLTSIGFKKNSAGQLTDPNGKVLPTFKILVGAGWTDFITQAQIISENLSKLGISTIIDQAPWSAYISSLMSGTYDMAICWGISGPTPYYVYYQRLNPAFSASKIGESALSDYSRYTNPLITSALEVYASTSDMRLQKQAMYTIERIVLDDVPFIPLTNRTNFSNFSAARFVGWPSDSNPYCAGGATNGQGGEIILLNIHLK